MKRFLAAVFFTALLVMLAACGMLRQNTSAAATATPTSSTSRTARTEPVTVNQTVANADAVNGSQKVTGTAPAATTAPTPIETPATGDFPLMYLVGVLGLILICSAGLLMLRRI